MKRCKSAPGLLYVSQASPPPTKIVRRYGTLPATLLKRTDMSFIMSGSFGAVSTTNLRRRATTKKTTTIYAAHVQEETRTEGVAQPETVTTINEEELPPPPPPRL